MNMKPIPEPFNKADSPLRIPSLQFDKLSDEAKEILIPGVPGLDADWDEIPPGNSTENSWFEP